MQTIDVSELTPQILELLSKIESGEELFITDKDQPVAKLVLVNGRTDDKPKRRQAGLTNSVAWMSPDFNEPLEDFAEYM